VGVSRVEKERRISREKAKDLARKTGTGAKKLVVKGGSGAKKLVAKGGSGAKKLVAKGGSGAKRLAVRTGSGAKRVATARGRRVKKRMDDYDARMLAVEWTSKKMLRDYLRFNVVGVFNQLFALTLYASFYWANLWPEHRAVTAWVLSVFIGQIEAHYTHYRFTFRSASDYWTSFKRTMTIYTTILVFSTISETILVERMLINHWYAFGINTVMFGYVNFAFLRWLAFPPEQDKFLLNRMEEE
jgi:putative flippase GtrA